MTINKGQSVGHNTWLNLWFRFWNQRRIIHEMKECDSNFVVNEDSLIQILLWLPVVSLLRFKSVSKSWRAIIGNPFFIHNHATFPSSKPTTTTTTNQLGLGLGGLGIPLFFRISRERATFNLFTVSGDEFEVFEDLGTPPPPYYNRVRGDCKHHPFLAVTVVGCCNGIICLHNTGYCNDITLWNPAIKQCRFLPISFPLEEGKRLPYNNYFDDFVSNLIGFGFDVKTKDYKVLQITSFEPAEGDDKESGYGYAHEVQVYSLITDSWKRCKDTSTTLSNLIMHGDYWNQGHYLNGTYLFLAGYLYEDEEDEDEDEEEGKLFQEPTTNSRQICLKPVITSFDFTEENFRIIQLPFDYKNKTSDGYKYIIFFGEKIAFTNACEAPCANGSYCEYLDIWVLNEYGGNESWSKFYTFTSSSQPKFITDNGEFILLDGAKHLQLLNIVTGEIKDLQCDRQGSSRRDGTRISRVGAYKPSLVPIAGNGATDNNLQV